MRGILLVHLLRLHRSPRVIILLVIVWWTCKRSCPRIRAIPITPIAEGPSISRNRCNPAPDIPRSPGRTWPPSAPPRNREAQRLRPAPRRPAHARIPIDRAIDLLLNSGVLTKPWKNPATTTQPYQLDPPTETQAKPSVENRT